MAGEAASEEDGDSISGCAASNFINVNSGIWNIIMLLRSPTSLETVVNAFFLVYSTCAGIV